MTNHLSVPAHGYRSTCSTRECIQCAAYDSVSAVAEVEYKSKAHFEVEYTWAEKQVAELRGQAEALRNYAQKLQELSLTEWDAYSDTEEEPDWEEEEDYWEDEYEPSPSFALVNLILSDVREYNLDKDFTQGLIPSLVSAKTIAFSLMPQNSRWRKKHEELLNNYLGIFGDPENREFLRGEALASHVRNYLNLLEEIRRYSLVGPSMVRGWKVSNRVKAVRNELIAHYFRPIKSPSSVEEIFETNDYLAYVSEEENLIRIGLNQLDVAFHSAFLMTSIKTPAAIADIAETRYSWIASNFPKLTSEYSKTEELRKIAVSMKQSIEDEYFIEQVNDDYYPNILKSLESVNFKEANPEQKESVISETEEQLKIIQAGLQKIIDSSTARSLQETKNQTLFLRTKMGDSPDQFKI